MVGYEPAEDTFLLLKWAKKFAKGKILEIGVGSGYILENLLKKGFDAYGVEIDKDVLKYLKEKFKDRVWYSDLFSNVNDKYDLIIFNPPYLPEEGWEDEKTKLWTVGGKEGNEIILKFIEQLPFYLKEGGKAIIIVSSLSNPNKV